MALFDRRQIVRVKVLGVRNNISEKALGVGNATVYCLLILYDDGSRDLKEVTTAEMGRYLEYIQVLTSQ